MQVPLSHMTSRSAAWHMLHTRAACFAEITDLICICLHESPRCAACSCTGSPAASRCTAPGHSKTED